MKIKSRLRLAQIKILAPSSGCRSSSRAIRRWWCCSVAALSFSLTSSSFFSRAEMLQGIQERKPREIATPQISSCEWRHILESRTAAMCSEEGGAYASAIGQESREDKLENAELQNQIGGRSVTLGHHPTRTRADAKPSKRKRMAQKRPVR